MHRGEYKELDFPPMPVHNQKSTTLVGPIKGHTPSPVDLCTTQWPASTTEKQEKKRKFVPATFLHSLFDDIRHIKNRTTEDTQITPTHQSDSISVVPCAFMSNSPAVVGLPSTSNTCLRFVYEENNRTFFGILILHNTKIRRKVFFLRILAFSAIICNCFWPTEGNNLQM